MNHMPDNAFIIAFFLQFKLDNDKIISIKLETHQTKDIRDEHVNGSLTVIWRDWDKKIKIIPEMVYVSSVNPGEIKGPHIHTSRESYFVCIRGSVVFIVKDELGEYREITSSEDEPILVYVPKNFPSAHINPTNEVSTVLALASPAWRPDDHEMKNLKFNDYDWNKWKERINVNLNI